MDILQNGFRFFTEKNFTRYFQESLVANSYNYMSDFFHDALSMRLDIGSVDFPDNASYIDPDNGNYNVRMYFFNPHYCELFQTLVDDFDSYYRIIEIIDDNTLVIANDYSNLIEGNSGNSLTFYLPPLGYYPQSSYMQDHPDGLPPSTLNVFSSDYTDDFNISIFQGVVNIYNQTTQENENALADWETAAFVSPSISFRNNPYTLPNKQENSMLQSEIVNNYLDSPENVTRGKFKWYFDVPLTNEYTFREKDIRAINDTINPFLIIGNPGCIYFIPSLTPDISKSILYGCGMYNTNETDFDNFLLATTGDVKGSDIVDLFNTEGGCPVTSEGESGKFFVFKKELNSDNPNDCSTGATTISMNYASGTQNIFADSGTHLTLPFYTDEGVVRGTLPGVLFDGRVQETPKREITVSNDDIYLTVPILTKDNGVVKTGSISFYLDNLNNDPVFNYMSVDFDNSAAGGGGETVS